MRQLATPWGPHGLASLTLRSFCGFRRRVPLPLASCPLWDPSSGEEGQGMWGLSTKQPGLAPPPLPFLAVGLGRGGRPPWWGSIGLGQAQVGPGGRS